MFLFPVVGSFESPLRSTEVRVSADEFQTSSCCLEQSLSSLQQSQQYQHRMIHRQGNNRNAFTGFCRVKSSSLMRS